MLTMDYVFVDKLLPDQLMEGDLIEFSDEFINEVAKVTSIEEFFADGRYTYSIQGRNEFDELLEIVVTDSDLLKLFVLK